MSSDDTKNTQEHIQTNNQQEEEHDPTATTS